MIETVDTGMRVTILDAGPSDEDLLSLPLAHAACARALIDLGINPYNVPFIHDAVTHEGYLLVTGRIVLLVDGEEIVEREHVETARHPWPDATDVDAVLALVAQAEWP